jgi:hypothetical protein
MNKFLFLLDRYKYGVLAVMITYIGIFMYLQISSYEKTYLIEVWDEKAEIQKEEEIEVKPENIEIPEGQTGEVKNISRDMQDKRKKSMEDWTESKPTASTKDIVKSVKELEKQFFKESGGAEKREKILEEKQKRLEQKTENSKTKNEPVAKTGGDKVFGGNVMVEWVLSGRDPHQNNNYFVRNPGYTCGQGASGFVLVKIKVDQGGAVVAATSVSSSSANPCMLEQARKYALMSRFAYSKSAPAFQEGTIRYTFVSQ